MEEKTFHGKRIRHICYYTVIVYEKFTKNWMLVRNRALLSLFFLAHWSISFAVDWKNNASTMAKKCDFYSKDVGNVKSKAEHCYNICANSTRCTHFTWSKFNNGTCWLKCGEVGKKDAIDTTDATMLCGIMDPKGRPQKIKNYTEFCKKPTSKLVQRMADVKPKSKIDWKGHWALGCTFTDESFARSKLDAEKCMALCQVTSECTHFSWNMHLNSTCFMRSGHATKDDAVVTNDNSYACGVKLILQ